MREERRCFYFERIFGRLGYCWEGEERRGWLEWRGEEVRRRSGGF